MSCENGSCFMKRMRCCVQAWWCWATPCSWQWAMARSAPRMAPTEMRSSTCRFQTWWYVVSGHLCDFMSCRSSVWTSSEPCSSCAVHMPFWHHSRKVIMPCCQVQDYWAPSNVAALNAGGFDLGSSAPIPVSNNTLIFMGGRDGSYYLLKADALGGSASTPLGFIPPDATMPAGTGGLYK